MTPEPTPLVTVLPCEADREALIEFTKLAYVTGFNDGWADGNGEGDAVNTVCRGDGLGDFLSGVSSNDAIRSLSQPVEGSAGASVGVGWQLIETAPRDGD